MLTGRPCICVLDANAYWTEQLFKRCTRFAEVLLLKPLDFRSHCRSRKRFRGDRSLRPVGDHLWEQYFSMPPGWFVELWRFCQLRLARAVCSFVGDQPLILVITYPQYRSLLRELRPNCGIYYNFDDYRDNWPRYSMRVPDWEAEAVRLAHLTICIARYRANTLRQQHAALSDRIHHLPIGCTPEFMSDSVGAGAWCTPPSVARLRRPVVGYVGALNRRFDFGFLAEVAVTMPDVTFALGGRVLEDGPPSWRIGLRKARKLENVKFLGWIEHNQLGAYLNAFDALFMCYSECNFNLNACPAKLWDYLGTGKPIVANAANPETLLHAEVIHCEATPVDFGARLRFALTHEPTHLRTRRLQIAREHTWEMLSYRLERLIPTCDH